MTNVVLLYDIRSNRQVVFSRKSRILGAVESHGERAIWVRPSAEKVLRAPSIPSPQGLE